MEETNEKDFDNIIFDYVSCRECERIEWEVSMNLADVTLEQLRAATKTQILNFISNKLSGLTKLQLCRLLLRVGDIDVDNLLEFPDRAITTGDSRGELTRVQPFRDISGDKTRTKLSNRTYYPSGCVDVWTLIQLDASDLEVGRTTIKHSEDPNIQPIPTVSGIGG